MRKIEKQLDEMSEAMQSALKLIIIATFSIGGIFIFFGTLYSIINIILK